MRLEAQASVDYVRSRTISTETLIIPEKYEDILRVSEQTLDMVIKSNRIDASGDGVYLGGDFTRDGAITAAFALRAETLRQINTGEPPRFAPRIADVLISKIDQQSRIDIPERGVKVGQMPHEIRTNPLYFQHLINPPNGEKPFYLNPDNGYVENFDAADSTGLWVYAVGKYIEGGFIRPNAKIYGALRLALEHISGEVDEGRELVGYEYDGTREVAELRNETWKDSERAFLHPNGQLPSGKVYDIWNNGVAWAALEAGKRVFATIDPDFSARLSEKANALKEKINSPLSEGGFITHDDFAKSDYFAEALTEEGPLLGPALDPALLLGLYVNGDSPIKKENMDFVVNRVMSEQGDLFDPEAGLRTYSSLGDMYGIVYDSGGGYYHRGPNTFWPWNSEMFATGAEHFGYADAARKVREAMLEPLVNTFETPIELFLRDYDGALVPYSNQQGQVSCPHQAWTAGAVLEAVESLREAA